MEFYFEVDDFVEFLNLLEKRKEVKLVHSPKKHYWQQRVVRIYDPDFHIIKIGESMKVIPRRYLSQEISVEKVCDIIQHLLEFVQQCM